MTIQISNSKPQWIRLGIEPIGAWLVIGHWDFVKNMSIPWLLSIFWFLALVSKTLYYLYLWQIKEYRFDRFFALFREPKGYASVLTRPLIFACCLFAASFILPLKVTGVLFLLLYMGEVLLWAKSIVRQEATIPVVTAKTFSLLLLSLASGGALFLLLLAGPLSPLQVLLVIDCMMLCVISFWVMVEKPLTFLAKRQLVWKAQKKRKALSRLVAVGITGSFGKTSTKEFLAAILAHRFHLKTTLKHQNTEVGASRAILAMPANTEVFVAEMAAYRKGDIAEISSVVKPTVGILTGIGSQHLALFGSQQAIVETKFELAAALPEGGTLIVNADSPLVKFKVQSSKFKVTNQNLKLITYSLHDKDAHVHASDVNETLRGLGFTVHAALPGMREAKETMHVNLLGRHSISNLLAATACALCLGMNVGDIASAMSSLKAFPRTLEPKTGPNGSLVIDDTYNASYEGVMAALHVLSLAQGKKIVILTSLIELGKNALSAHRNLGEALARVADQIIVTDRRHEKELKSRKTVFVTDAKKILEEIDRNRLKSNDVILLEGRIPQEVVRRLTR